MLNLARLVLLAQQNPAPSDAEAAAAAGLGIGVALFGIFCAIVVSVAMGALMFWKVFEKAGKPGWASIVPFYNIIVLLDIAGRPLFWFILWLIPCVNLVIAVLVCMDIARKFEQGGGFGIGLILLPYVFFPILGFGSARYNPHA